MVFGFVFKLDIEGHVLVSNEITAAQNQIVILISSNLNLRIVWVTS